MDISVKKERDFLFDVFNVHWSGKHPPNFGKGCDNFVIEAVLESPATTRQRLVAPARTEQRQRVKTAGRVEHRLAAAAREETLALSNLLTAARELQGIAEEYARL